MGGSTCDNVDTRKRQVPDGIECFGDLNSTTAQDHTEKDLENNPWAKMFDSGVVVGANGLRVPLADKRDRKKAGQRSVLPDGKEVWKRRMGALGGGENDT